MTLAIRQERRKRRTHDLADAFGHRIFRLGEFGAIACYVFAAFTFDYRLRNHTAVLNAADFVALGVFSYCAGWLGRFALTRKVDPI